MAKYKVVSYFTDLQDADYPYNVGDTYPRNGLTVTAERIAELSGKSNLRGIPLIEEVREKAEKVETVKEDAEKAETGEDAPKKRGRKSTK